VRDPTSVHILPGGRIAPGETMDQAVRREVAEETGCRMRELQPLGVLQYHHLGPDPDGHRIPDFLQVVFAAQADSFDPDAREIGGYELDARFMDLTDARMQLLAQRERILLDAAIAALG
jgi:8-oxo-dGTP pyrophosphatase MutT (NUDIX family)